MSEKKNYTPFNPLTVPLQGSNLIEASAGTGKTYSIAIMVLRLVLEKKLNVKEILMVTFTKAAVAELEERIRFFIRSAARASQGTTIGDNTIRELVEAAIAIEGAEEVQRRLREAILFLDETSVLTIHSFCQQALSEFAFETGQVFGAETMQDITPVLTEQINQFWRTKITTLPLELLLLLHERGVSQEAILRILKEHLNGKKYIAFEPGKAYDCDDVTYAGWLKELRELKEAEEKLRECLENDVAGMRADLEKRCGKGNAKRYLLPLLDRVQQFLGYLANKRDSAYIEKDFSDLLERLDECDEALAVYEVKLRDVTNHLYCLAIQQASGGILQYKLRRNLLSFDDMIFNLHRAVMREGSESLINSLRNKYKAVFIDEFQDTDRLQYEIFQKAFGEGHISFYIGDPKQSIYAWRKADIFTYFEARNAVSHLYEMNVNYRSSTSFIEAMNAFFRIDDPFHFKDEKNSIEYINVEAPPQNGKGLLSRHSAPAVPISISLLQNKDAICEAVAAQVAELLDKETYVIMKDDDEAKVKPSDIGILVRTNKEGALIKAALSRYGVPAVTIGDEKVLSSREALYVWYLLKAFESPEKTTINRALLSPFTGYSASEILRLDEERSLELFKSYKKAWEEDGIYTAMMNFIADYGVRKVLLQNNTENGERIITNLIQSVELIHKVQAQKGFSPLELIAWLKRAMDGMETEGDEYEQRIESDEEAVKIVTIHKSKGLEYNIVLAPFLDFISENKYPTCSFRHPETGEYITAEREHLSEEQSNWMQRQDEQENRRLIYVALTRAVYKCFIYKNTSSRGRFNYNKSSLVPFIDGCKSADVLLIDTGEPLQVPEGYSYAGGQSRQPLAGARIAQNFSLVQNNWYKMSYTSLAAKLGSASKHTSIYHRNAYDEFVFSRLPKGINTGNMLHFIFEHINFADHTRSAYILEEAVRRFAFGQKELFLQMLPQLLEHVLSTTIGSGESSFSLSEVLFQHRLHEFEFDFTIPEFDPRVLNQLSDENIQVAVKDLQEAEGVLNGKVDLFFMCKGKYYILDWKSNFLGSSVEDYSTEKIAVAMNESNYHLQYMLYTLAASKYLHSRLGDEFNYERDFGGVIYLFIRGVRKDKHTGIFTARLTEKQLDRLSEMLTKRHAVPSVSGYSVEGEKEKAG